jgi:hypothetical protein
VKCGVVPLDPRSVVPNLFGWCDWHDLLPLDENPSFLSMRHGV